MIKSYSIFNVEWGNVTSMNEHEISTKWENIVCHYQDTYAQKWFKGIGGSELRYICPQYISSANCLVILGGRTEFIEKYGELLYDLRGLDCDIYSYDHLGQGLSTRLLTNPHKGHVLQFSDYVADLKTFVEEVIGGRYRRIVVMGFSMGGAVSTIFIQDYPDAIDAAVLCCPMFGINTSPLSPSFVGWLAARAVSLGYGERYVPGGKDFDFRTSFTHNRVTSSIARFQLNQAWISDKPKLALGSPTLNWLYQASLQTAAILNKATEISIPLLLLQSGRDRMVMNKFHHYFCKKAQNCRLHTIKDARHELLMERDELRDQAIHLLNEFLQEHFE